MIEHYKNLAKETSEALKAVSSVNQRKHCTDWKLFTKNLYLFQTIFK